MQSARAKLLLLIVAVFTLTLIVIGAGSLSLVRRTEQALWQSRQKAAAQTAARTLATFLGEAQESMTLIGLLDSMTLVAQPAISANILRVRPALLEVIRVDPSGNLLVAATSGDPVLSNLFTITQASWFQQARAGAHFIGPVQFSAAGTPYTILAQAAPNGDVMAARLDLTIMRTVLAGISTDTEGRIYVLNRDGHVLVASDALDRDLGAEVVGPEALALIKGVARDQTSAIYVNLHGATVFGAAAGIPGTDLTIVTEMPEHLTRDASSSALLLLIVGLMGFGTLMILLTWLLASRLIFRPITTVAAAAARIAGGEMGVRVPVLRRDELGAVAVAFNTMADAIAGRTAELQDLAASLEQQVDARTAELRHESAERERLQAETVAQATTLMSLSTPLIPISDKVLVLPLVGTLDDWRLGQVQNSLLGGVEQFHPTYAILDITGVPVVDDRGADALTQTAHMIRMLGTQLVLTGIRPEVAQTLVSIGADLGPIRTFSTLQQAIEATRAPAFTNGRPKPLATRA